MSRRYAIALRALIALLLLQTAVAFGPVPRAAAAASLTIQTITFNVIGLDSNKVTDGPSDFPVGARICNTGDAAATNVVATFVRDGSNAYISVVGPTTITFPSLAAGACTDAYFTVRIARDTAAYGTTLPYHIAATATGVGAVTTPIGYQLYVEHLVSQNRNNVQSITGPTTVYVGQSYTYTLQSSTSTSYDQLESFLNLSNVIFRIDSVAVTYSIPAGSTGSSVYADACGFDENPADGRAYRSCVGNAQFPAQYPGGVGGNVMTTYHVTVLSTGTTTATDLIYDFSGSSYHYNSDFGTGINSISVTAVNPPDLGLTLTHAGTFDPGANGTLTVGVTNAAGASATTGTAMVTITLPTGLTYVGTGSGGNGFTCSATGQTVTCTAPAGIAAGANLSFPIVVAVANAASGTLNVTGTVATPNDSNTANNNASDQVAIAAPSAAIGDVVFEDTNGNGIQDIGEQGLVGVTVTLSGPVSRTTTTTTGGAYGPRVELALPLALPACREPLE